MLDCLLDHKAQEHFFEVIDAPTLQLSIELLMRNTEKICQWLGMVKPEQMRKGSRHEDLKGDTVALAKLVMKEGEKPGKFLLPHGIILLGWWLRIFMEDNPYGIQNQSSFRIMELSVLRQLKNSKPHAGNPHENRGGARSTNMRHHSSSTPTLDLFSRRNHYEPQDTPVVPGDDRTL